MKLSKHKKHLYERRIKAIKTFLKSGLLYETASDFNIHPRTLKRWITRYKQGGKKNLKRAVPCNRHWRRLPVDTEKQIVFLKENKPTLTLSKAQKILARDGIVLSLKGIWNIWKRYGLIGFDKEKGSLEYLQYITPTQEVRAGIQRAEQRLKNDDKQEAARIMNTLPSCPETAVIEILEKIPDHLLNFQRRIDKLLALFGKIPFSNLAKKARILRKKAEAKGLFYLALRAGIWEAHALSWTDKPKELISLVHSLQRRLKDNKGILRGDPFARFTMFILEGQAWSFLFQTKEAIRCSNRCRTLIRSFSASTEFKYWLAGFLANIGHYREAEKLIKQIISENNEDPRFITFLCSAYATAGEYRSALRILHDAQKQEEGIRSQMALLRALCSLGSGEMDKSLGFVEIALTEAQKAEIQNHFHMATLIQAGAHAGINDKKAAKEFLRKPIPMLRKFHMKRNIILRHALLGQNIEKQKREDQEFSPVIRSALMVKRAHDSLKITDYRKAFTFASTQKILGYFHLSLLFFPGSIHNLLLKGRPTYLPSNFLRLPVFQKNIPAYHLGFLGSVHIYRNEALVRTHILPKETAFLIYLALSKNKRIPIESLYDNFWQKSKNQARNLSHLLVRIRKILKLPTAHLYIRRGFLHFRAPLTTDYQYYKEILIQAKVLERAGEWGFAVKEYLRAFSLFRGEPFKKMYDNQSENMRRMILNKLEITTLEFAQRCLEHNNRKDAQKVLKKVSIIIPNSNAIQKPLNDSENK